MEINVHALLQVLVMAAVIAFTRFLPFLAFPEGKKTRDIAIELLPNYTRDNPEILLTIDGVKHFIKP